LQYRKLKQCQKNLKKKNKHPSSGQHSSRLTFQEDYYKQLLEIHKNMENDIVKTYKNLEDLKYEIAKMATEHKEIRKQIDDIRYYLEYNITIFNKTAKTIGNETDKIKKSFKELDTIFIVLKTLIDSPKVTKKIDDLKRISSDFEDIL